MSPKTLLMWLAIIIIGAYLANINLGHLLSALLNAAQQMHNSNAH